MLPVWWHWAHLGNPGSSPYVRILNLTTSARLFFPVTHFTGPRVRVRPSPGSFFFPLHGCPWYLSLSFFLGSLQGSCISLVFAVCLLSNLEVRGPWNYLLVCLPLTDDTAHSLSLGFPLSTSRTTPSTRRLVPWARMFNVQSTNGYFPGVLVHFGVWGPRLAGLSQQGRGIGHPSHTKTYRGAQVHCLNSHRRLRRSRVKLMGLDWVSMVPATFDHLLGTVVIL